MCVTATQAHSKPYLRCVYTEEDSSDVSGKTKKIDEYDAVNHVDGMRDENIRINSYTYT